jgi:hypothetical protein
MTVRDLPRAETIMPIRLRNENEDVADQTTARPGRSGTRLRARARLERWLNAQVSSFARRSAKGSRKPARRDGI